MYRIYLIALVFLVGCGANLRPDPVPVSSYAANYPAGEGIACGVVFNGLGICPVKAGSALPTITFQGYYAGTVTVDSDECNIHDSFTYAANGPVAYKPPGVAGQNSCLLDFVLAHQLPNEANSGLHIAPLKGRLWLTVGDSPITFYQTNKLSDGVDGKLVITKITSPTISLSFRSCGVTYDVNNVPVTNGTYTVKLSDLHAPLTAGTRCALTGAIFDGRGVYMVRWMYFSYSNQFAPLPKPVLALANKKLTVTADTAVSMMELDAIQKIGNSASFDFDSTQKHTIRFLSVQGRLLVATWNVAQGAWSWIQ